MNPIPEGYPQLTPSIATNDASAAIDYYQKVFDAEVRMCLREPSGKVAHAELRMGTGLLMLCDKYEGYNHTPMELGASTVVLHLYVENVDAVLAKAVEEGGKLILPASNQFYGDRSGRVADPFGHIWLISSRIEDVTPADLEVRMAQMNATASA